MEENERERRARSGPGIVATLLGGFLLVVVGFALGLVVGALREEPGVVVRHLAGESQEVPLLPPGLVPGEPGAAPAPAEPAPDFAETPGTNVREEVPAEAAPFGAPDTGLARAPGAPAPAAPPDAILARPAPPVPLPSAPTQPEAAPAPARAAPPAVSARPPTSGFAVQVGAFRDGPQAERLATRLRGKGFTVYVMPGSASPDSRWRVRVGPVSTRPEADRLAARLKTDEKLPTWVLDAAR